LPKRTTTVQSSLAETWVLDRRAGTTRRLSDAPTNVYSRAGGSWTLELFVFTIRSGVRFTGSEISIGQPPLRGLALRERGRPAPRWKRRKRGEALNDSSRHQPSFGCTSAMSEISIQLKRTRGRPLCSGCRR
jgi:hypothetical protein